jgi:hypothetical protein
MGCKYRGSVDKTLIDNLILSSPVLRGKGLLFALPTLPQDLLSQATLKNYQHTSTVIQCLYAMRSDARLMIEETMLKISKSSDRYGKPYNVLASTTLTPVWLLQTSPTGPVAL